mgnify:CR=1 FL=1
MGVRIGIEHCGWGLGVRKDGDGDGDVDGHGMVRKVGLSSLS